MFYYIHKPDIKADDLGMEKKRVCSYVQCRHHPCLYRTAKFHFFFGIMFLEYTIVRNSVKLSWIRRKTLFTVRGFHIAASTPTCFHSFIFHSFSHCRFTEVQISIEHQLLSFNGTERKLLSSHRQVKKPPILVFRSIGAVGPQHKPPIFLPP